MIFYFFQLAIFFCYSLFFYFVRPNFLRTYYVFITIQLSLVMGLRDYWIGTDTRQYVGIFLSQDTSFNGNGVAAYNFLSKTIWNLTNGNYHVFLLALSFLTVLFFILSLQKLKSDFFESFIAVFIYISFYFYFESFNIQRQMLAVSIAMFATCFFIERKYLKALTFFLLAVGIHSTALIALLNFALIKIKKDKKSLVVSMIALSIMLANVNIILQLFAEIFSHYNMYISTVGSGSLAAGGGALILGLFFILIAGTAFFMTDAFSSKIYSFTFFATVLGSLFYIIGMNSQMLIRIAAYFLIFAPVFIPRAIKKISNRFLQKNIVNCFCCAIVLIAGLTIMTYKLLNNFGDIVPYSSDIRFWM